jgi:hypothetical protein
MRDVACRPDRPQQSYAIDFSTLDSGFALA